MISYTDVDQFLDGDIYDLSDDVKGGSDGDSNVPIKTLFDRTRYLYNRLSGFADTLIITGNYTWNIDDYNKAFIYNGTVNATFTLPNVTTVHKGFIIPIVTRINAVKALTISGGTILHGNESRNNMFMHDAEKLWVMAAGSGETPDHWEIVFADGNFLTAGESFGARKQMKNTFILDGSIVNRVDVPRLTEFALSLTNNQAIVSDSTWLSFTGLTPRYRGCFSLGNGTSTIRLPDERGLFDRYLDLGRGLDTSRIHNYAGGFEDMSVEQHNHVKTGSKFNKLSARASDIDGSNTPKNLDDGQAGAEYRIGGMGDAAWSDATLIPYGSSQTQAKNIGKIPLIRF